VESPELKKVAKLPATAVTTKIAHASSRKAGVGAIDLTAGHPRSRGAGG
jgi:hypothetical protein